MPNRAAKRRASALNESMPHDISERRVTENDIHQRAYELYQARGAEHGQDWNDWFRAERELGWTRVSRSR
jgi:hypothetical protein